MRVLLDGQERSRIDLACDYTLPATVLGHRHRRLGLGGGPIADGPHQLQIVAEDAAGNLTTVTRTVTIDAHGPTATLTRASGKTITVARVRRRLWRRGRHHRGPQPSR